MPTLCRKNARLDTLEARKHEEMQRREDIFTRPQLAMASDQRASRGRSIVLHALNSPWRVHLLVRRVRAANLLKDDVTQTHW